MRRLRGRLVEARQRRDAVDARRRRAGLDVLDVADLESEAEHEYALLGAREGRAGGP